MAQTAIEYGARRLRLLEFEGSTKNLRIVDVVDVDLHVPDTGEEDFDADDVRAERIAEAAKEAGVARDPSGMALDASHALFREFDLPFTNAEQIARVVRFEAESHLPVAIEDTVVQHLVLRETRDKSHLLVSAVEKEFLLDRFDVLDEAGFDPMFVDLDVFALLHALVGTGVASEHDRFAVVNAQESTTSLLILAGGKLHAVRSIRVGTHARVDHAEGDVDEHERDVIEARTHSYLSNLEREIRRTLTTLPGVGPLETVFITGSGSRLTGFAESIARVLGTETEPLDLLARVNHKLDDDEVERFGPDIGVALGIAYKLSGLDLTHTDFRREECRYTKKFDQVKMPLVFLSFLLAGTVFFLGLERKMEVDKLETQYFRMGDIASLQLKESLGDDEAAERVIARTEVGPGRLDTILRAMEDERNRIAQELGRFDTIDPLNSALTVWAELFDLVRDNEDLLVPIVFDRVDVETYTRNPEIVISGRTLDRTHYQELLNLLDEHPMFSVRSAGSQKTIADPVPNRFENLTLDLTFEADDGGET